MSKTIEEKAIAYDKALEKAREYWETDDDNTLDIKARGTMEYLFPELAESEDEKIKRLLISGMKNLSRSAVTFASVPIKDVIDWLEKQGKETSEKEFTFKALPRLLEMIEVSDRAKAYTEKLAVALDNEGYHTDAKIVRESIKIMNGEEVPMATMDEQKPVDNIEPKFKVGDWITDGNNALLCVEKFEIDYGYELKATDGQIFHFVSPNLVDANYHLWSIADAKVGDVLHSIGWYNDCIFIFNGLDNWKFDEPNGDRAVATGYCCLFVSADKMEFGMQGPDCIEVNTVNPATKEQRDLLFRKMKEAGYEWDFEMKELKKINKNTDVGHEYFSDLLEKDDCDNIDDYAYQCAYCMSHDWMKDTATWDDVERACKLGAEWNEKHHKSSWGEEDEEMVEGLNNCLDELEKENGWCYIYVNDKNVKLNNVRNWLKSIKDRVQPQNWTKEDKERYISCLQRLSTGNPEQPETINSKWFKEHVYPQKQWKPSDEQMRAFEQMYDWYNTHFAQSLALNSLYNDIKKLKGE